MHYISFVYFPQTRTYRSYLLNPVRNKFLLSNKYFQKIDFFFYCNYLIVPKSKFTIVNIGITTTYFLGYTVMLFVLLNIVTDSERKTVISIREFWPRVRLEVWKNGGNSVVHVDKKGFELNMLSQFSR